ncbi:MAG: hypothetical protein ABR925_06020 [Acidimicrobiales bacterium]
MPVYGEYFLAYRAAKEVNDVGCSFGRAMCVAAHLAVASYGLPGLEASGLAGDAALDWLKNKTTGNHESIYDEDLRGGVLPRFIDHGGPKTWLPGLSRKNDRIHVDFEW